MDDEKGLPGEVLRTIQARKESEEYTKQKCNHIKLNGKAAIAGQKTIDGEHIIWICLYCSTTWLDDELPKHLEVDMEKVGGDVTVKDADVWAIEQAVAEGALSVDDLAMIIQDMWNKENGK